MNISILEESRNLCDKLKGLGKWLKIFSFVLILCSSFGLEEGKAQQSLSTKVQGPDDNPKIEYSLQNRFPAFTQEHERQKNPKAIDQIISRLSLKEKIGQLFIFGFTGKDFSPRLRKAMLKYNPGALIAFKRNIGRPAQVARFNRKIQEQAGKYSQGLPLLIMLDQEGGMVTRLKWRPNTVSALALGQAQNPKLSEAVGILTGKILSLLGFNMNLAPVMDLSNPFEKNFIGNRSFGQDPGQVNHLAASYAHGLYQSGVIPTAKHFPGHGGLIADSHKMLPKKFKSLEEMKHTDLMPFQFIAEINLPSAIMVAHMALPQIDPSGLPATFSKVLVEDLLLGHMGYRGLVITDDVEMQGAEEVGEVGERAVRAIEAGVDMVMVAWNPNQQGKAYRALFNAVKSGRISMTRVDRSLRKIVGKKLGLKSQTDRWPSSDHQLNKKYQLYVNQMNQLTHQVIHANLRRALRGYSYLENSLSPKQNLLVFSADSHFTNSLRQKIKGPMSFVSLRKGHDPQVRARLTKNPKALGLFYVSGGGTAKMLEQWLPKKLRQRLIVINTTHSGMIPNQHQYKAVININSKNHLAGVWLMQFLRQDLSFDKNTVVAKK